MVTLDWSEIMSIGIVRYLDCVSTNKALAVNGAGHPVDLGCIKIL